MARPVRRIPRQPTKSYCDGSHKLTQGEEPNRPYWCDDAGKRHELSEHLPGIRSY